MGIAKPFDIKKELVREAFARIRANAGAAGIDRVSLQEYESNLDNNLYKLWNRMSSGTYFPPAVKAVPIPKKNGGVRILGIPTVEDRVAQMVVKLVFEPGVERCFLPDSYGYRPNKSAIDAIRITRKRCWKYDWVLEFDIKGLFDNIRHDLLMKVVRKHTELKWVILYIERWIKAPLQHKDGTQEARTKGTPQGGVVSPVLSNLFLHYVFDKWMNRIFPNNLWCRYADDGLVHCRSQREAEEVKARLQARFQECGLEMHPDKTKIVYCHDNKRKREFPVTSFDFLGYTFRSRRVINKATGELFCGFAPAVGKNALKSMASKIRKSRIRNRVDLSIEQVAKMCNPFLRGWIEYYHHFHASELKRLYDIFDGALAAWAMRKYKAFRRCRGKAYEYIRTMSKTRSYLFVHWQQGRC